jgi:ABC-2 type transport system permease protein
MNRRWHAVRCGLARGRIEVRQHFVEAGDLITILVFSAVGFIILLSLRHVTAPGGDFSLGTLLVPGVIGMNIAYLGLGTIAAILVTDREDGTLLRAKIVPDGMTGYMVAKIIDGAASVLLGLVIPVGYGVLFFHGLAVGSAGSWLTLAWVLVLGLLATLPIGIILGSLLPSAKSANLLTPVAGGLIAISGVFYPITHLPHWLQPIGQVFPFYWAALGARSALLPHTMAALEIGHSWRHWQTAAVLGAWAIAGLAVTPWVLRRMASRQSGSRVAAARDKQLQRVG